MIEGSVILYHATKSAYLDSILIEGLKPGTKEGLYACSLTEGWCTPSDNYERELCKAHLFLSGNMETIEAFISNRPEFDIILLIFLPIDMVTIMHWKNFKEYRDHYIDEHLKSHPKEKREDIVPGSVGYTYLSKVWEIWTKKGTIDPKYIIGCLEVKRRTKDANDWIYEFIKI
jgi:hypothetical protein